jgi:hypothetical protein
MPVISTYELRSLKLDLLGRLVDFVSQEYWFVSVGLFVVLWYAM